MPFSSIPMLKSSREILGLTVRGCTPTESLLLCGSSRANRENAARLVSRYHLCTGLRDLSCPCPNCRLGQDHPDLFVANPSAAGNILTSTLSEAISFLGENSITSDKRCFILHGADRLTVSSSGDLLKTLETPMLGVLVVMTCSDRRNVPKTLASRAKLVYTGDANRLISFGGLMDSGASGKMAEDYARLAGKLTLDMTDNLEQLKEARSVAQYMVTWLIHKNQAKVLDRVSDFLATLNQETLSMFIEVVVATLNDVQLGQLTAVSNISVPSSLDWVQTTRGLIDEETLMKTSLAFRKVLTIPEQQRRAMLLWAIGAVSAMLETSKLVVPEEVL